MSDNYAKEQAVAQASSIAEMVGALHVDYDRLEELRNEYDSLQWDVQNSEGEDLKEAQAALSAWEAENEEEHKLLLAEANDNESEEDAREAIQNDPLSVEVRGSWHTPTQSYISPDEFMILLCTGGPAVRIVGDLDDNCQPCRAWIEYQDWGTPWTHAGNIIEQSTLLEYCQQFYFGE